MIKVAVIIPTHNRSELLKKAVSSVLSQTYKDLELIIVDVGLEERSERVVGGFNDPRIIYIKNERELNGSAARNIGIKQAKGDFIAFLDDDDEWLPEKLDIQMSEFEKTSDDVGFCFSAVSNVYNDKVVDTKVPSGVRNYYEDVLFKLKGFLNVTLIVKKYVFDDVGYFDESLPSHQETDLVIRIAKKYKGLGINKPLVRVSMKKGYKKIGFYIKKIITGREMVINKYMDEFKKRPTILASHWFRQGILYRDDGQFEIAKKYFKKAWKIDHKLFYLLHFFSLIWGGGLYNMFKLIRKSK